MRRAHCAHGGYGGEGPPLPQTRHHQLSRQQPLPRQACELCCFKNQANANSAPSTLACREGRCHNQRQTRILGKVLPRLWRPHLHVQVSQQRGYHLRDCAENHWPQHISCSSYVPYFRNPQQGEVSLLKATLSSPTANGAPTKMPRNRLLDARHWQERGL